MNYRKLTPSMSLLLAFEASARHESFTRAAQELSLTQSAVSRQVQALEAMLNLELFTREGKRIVPTDIGRAYMTEIAQALTLIRTATLQALTANAPKTQLRVATLPTFGAKWLLPRLHRFYQAHPDLQIDLDSRIGAADFATQDLDAAIVVGDGRWPDVIAHRLYAEELVLVGNPATLPFARKSKRGAVPTIKALEGLTLLRVRSFPDAWREWCAHSGLPHDALRPGPSFELTSHLIQAVVAGIGVGLVPRMLVEDELREKRLLSPFEAVASSRSYYLVYPERAQRHPVLIAFRDWLLQELAAPDAAR
ncbi:LysR substrate-binding domain-containing protein [Paraburkholderia unamae]|uniref:LysR family transcriptional regulator n=1 Tax=Paraburkholderia unamae TaxID=219649 RepID=A0ABX5KE64_9BURK|nr:LysR substrate-binding domain-containing protein [Paraburkholderia unamae]PVX70835.1 LysR family transcriptional regulator [Paraburkholderia unamae]CAG9246777.1 DNA-binding transcriptional regulator, LysR family [Paraburkholderia unamae]